jgi:hypothetical protein
MEGWKVYEQTNFFLPEKNNRRRDFLKSLSFSNRNHPTLHINKLSPTQLEFLSRDRRSARPSMNTHELSLLCDSLRNLYQIGINIDARDVVQSTKWKDSLFQAILRIEQTSLDYWLGQAPGTADDPVTCMNPWPLLKSICHNKTTLSLQPPAHADITRLLGEIVLFIDAHPTSTTATSSKELDHSSQSTDKERDGPKAPEPYMCFTHQGSAKISEGRYRKLVAAAQSGHFDLFIDAVTGEHGYRPAGENDFALGKMALSAQRAAYLVELVEKQRPISPYKLTQLNKLKHPRRVLLAARRLVETDGDRSDWRVFRSVQQDGVTKYHFSPPSDFTYAVIRLLPPSSS